MLIKYANIDGSNFREYECDEALSFKDFSNQPVTHLDFNGKVIYSTVFYHETPDYAPFPKDMKGTTFIKCNLDNVIVPEGNMIIDCTQRRFKAQNDLNDWLIDENDNPVKPVDFKIYEKHGLEMPKPENIPSEKASKPIDLRAVAMEAM
jgi:hypothetical protein